MKNRELLDIKKSLLFLILIVVFNTAYANSFLLSWNDFKLPSNWNIDIRTSNNYNNALELKQIGEVEFTYKSSNSCLTVVYFIFPQDSVYSQLNNLKAYKKLNDYLDSLGERCLPILSSFKLSDNYYLLDTTKLSNTSILQTFSYNLIRYVSKDEINISDSGLSYTNYITIFSVLIIVLGWFINSVLNRKHEVAKERFKIRIEMFRTCLAMYDSAEKNPRFWLDTSFVSQFENAQKSVLTFGEKKEIDNINRLKKLLKDNQFADAKAIIQVLLDEIREALRKELHIK